MKKVILDKLTSRKLWLGILGLILAVINDPAGLGLSQQATAVLAASPIVSIISLALVDVIRELKGQQSTS